MRAGGSNVSRTYVWEVYVDGSRPEQFFDRTPRRNFLFAFRIISGVMRRQLASVIERVTRFPVEIVGSDFPSQSMYVQEGVDGLYTCVNRRVDG